MDAKRNDEMTEQQVQSHVRMDNGESRRNCANSEKEWVRRLTTGKVAKEKKE